jgi:hypothetical protein
MADTSYTTPSRRNLFGLAAAGPAVASPEITAAIATYRACMAEGEASEATDEVTDLKSEEMEDAAAELAATPCRSVADLAAKLVFVVEVMNNLDAWHSLSDAEGDVLASAADEALALAGDAA